MRVIELFAGIGGCASALPHGSTVVQAVDQSPYAREAYAHNFDHPYESFNLAGLRPEQLAEADLWWMSPPCQPFTVRGRQRDLDDPRCQPFLRVLTAIEARRPTAVAMENVPGFRQSRAHSALVKVLEDCGYEWQERVDCPTRCGVPNRRSRFFLLATQGPMGTFPSEQRERSPLAGYLDEIPAPDLYLSDELQRRYRRALPIVDASDHDAVTFCFTSAYGTSPVHAGSYLRDDNGVRHFSPEEILRLLHFPARYRLPETIDRKRAWKLVGNALSIPSVSDVLAPLLGSLSDVDIANAAGPPIQ